VVGIIERATGRCWLEIVARRDAATLERIITAHVLPGSIIVTDAWGRYNNVATINNGMYDHQVVIHAQNFVNPVHNDVHLQTIDGVMDARQTKTEKPKWNKPKVISQLPCRVPMAAFTQYTRVQTITNPVE